MKKQSAHLCNAIFSVNLALNDCKGCHLQKGVGSTLDWLAKKAKKKERRHYSAISKERLRTFSKYSRKEASIPCLCSLN